ncbi:MAG: hemin receptor [Acidobacteria bacterium]|nr:hemin receptor [Acidobacteriota bacterium]
MTTLTERQKELIRLSFEGLEEYSDSIVKLFYGRLFEVAPQVRPLFRVDIGEQSRKLLDMLAVIVGGVDDFEALRPRLEELGRKHVEYGAKPAHYDALRGALLWAFGRALETEFDKETKAAWEQLLHMVTAAMLEGANPAVR